MTATFRIEVDVREPELLRAVGTSVKPLTVGDFMVYAGDSDQPCMVIERKTVDDLLASIKDGRYRDQRERMVETGLPIVYILEGRPSEDKAMQGALENLALVHRIPVIPSANMRQTGSIVASLAKKLSTTAVAVPIVTYCPPRAKRDTPLSALEKMLTTVPGVSCTIAQSVSTVYATMAELLAFVLSQNSDATCLAAITIVGKTRRVGPALSRRIVNALIS